MTDKLYLQNSYLRAFDATVTASNEVWVALDRTAFYPGGGGQPADRGQLRASGEWLGVLDVREDDGGIVWHEVQHALCAGTVVHGELDWPYRYALMRAHALMHVVNTVARDRFGGVITGVQLGPERSRIDLKLDRFTRDHLPDFEREVNAVVARDLALSASVVSEEDFRRRPELVRTLDVQPPVVDGRVRIVEIASFDAQACGGTHVHTTSEVGVARIVKFDNKGKDNKRLYWELVTPA